MSIIVLLILLHLQSSSTLICIANNSLEIRRNELISNNNSFILRVLQNRTIYPYAKSTSCHVTIYTDYNRVNGNITIDFGINTNHTGNHIGIETWLPLTKENTSILSCIDYVCSSNNFCDQLFVEKWIYWLANINYEPLQSNLINRLTSGKQTGRCDATGITIQCPSRTCVAEFISHLNNSILGAGCTEDLSGINMEVFMKLQSIEMQPIEYKELTYICTSDNCNDETTFKHVWKETSSLFDFFKPIISWLRSRNKFRTSVSSTSGNSQKKKKGPINVPLLTSTHRPSTILFWSSGIFIVVLITIGISSYYLYSRNRPRYILAPVTA